MPSPKSQNVLIRGDACFACRARKVRCDGAHPICRRCEQANRECLYTGLPPRPRPTETLELHALRLERQIADMINSHNRGLLSHRVFEQFRTFGDVPRREKRILFPNIFIHPTSPSRTPFLASTSAASPSEMTMYQPEPFIARSHLDELFADWRPELGISIEQTVYLIRLFLPRRTYSAFFCNPTDILERSVLPPNHPQALHPGLLNAMFMIACALVGGVLQPHTKYFLEQARRHLQESLALADRITHFLWGSIILGTYYSRVGKFIECYVTLSTTIRFALGCGLAGGPPEDCILTPPQTVEDAVDRIHLIHSIYQADRGLSMYSSVGCVLSFRRGDPPTSPHALFRKALRYPLEVWPDVLKLKDAASQLDSVLLFRSTVSMLQERVEHLTTSIFYPSQAGVFGSNGLHGDQLIEFHAIKSELDALYTVIAPLIPWSVTINPLDINPTLIHLHSSYHGIVIILFNIVVLLDALGHEVTGVELEEARRRTLQASEALVGMARLSKSQYQMPSRSPQVVLILHLTNAVLILVRELKRSTIQTSTRQLAEYCDSLSVLMEVLQDTLTTVPSWAHIAKPIRRLLPSSANDLDLSTSTSASESDLLTSPVLRVSL